MRKLTLIVALLTLLVPFRMKAQNDLQSAYEAALAAIEDGQSYCIFTVVDNTKYYLTDDGYLSAGGVDAGIFTFEQVAASSSSAYEYGYLLHSQNNTRFSNPHSTYEEALTNGHLNTSSSMRDTWEAQVFFLNEDGKYAVRSTNAPSATSGWGWVGSAYWTVNVGSSGPLAEYSFDVNYVWQLEINEMIDVECELIFNGEVIGEDYAEQMLGMPPSVPSSFKELMHSLYSFTADVETVTNATTLIRFTAVWAGPFELSKDLGNAHWYNMNIRDSYWVAMDDTEPYHPSMDIDLTTPESQWAFGPVADSPGQVIVYNRAKGAGWSLAHDGTYAVMSSGEYAWDVLANSDGFVLREPDTDYNCLNQYGGSGGPLRFWNDLYSLTDNGSTFRVEEIGESGGDPVIETEGRRLALWCQVGGKTYELYRAIDKSSQRWNSDYSYKYKTTLTLDIISGSDTTRVMVDNGMAYTDEVMSNMFRPCMMFDVVRNKMYIFCNSKTATVNYGMTGFVYTSDIDEPKFTREVVFDEANWGWFAYFSGVTDEGQPILKHWSSAGYYNMTSTRISANNWDNVTLDFMYREDFDANYYSKQRFVNIVGNPYHDEVLVNGVVYTVRNGQEAYITWITDKSALEEFTIPEAVTDSAATLTVTGIAPYAFYGSSELTTVTIPETVNLIGESAFMYCNIKNIKSLNPTPPAVTNEYVFDSVNKSSCVVNVPAESIDLYKNAEGWRDFFNIGDFDYEGNVVVLDDQPLITEVSQFSSPMSEPSEGSLESLLDGDASTFWHSIWQNGWVTPGTHYLQVEMPEDYYTDGMQIVFRFTRRSNSDNDQTVLWKVMGIDENDEAIAKNACEELAVVETPFGSNSETLTSLPFDPKGYKYLRFYSEEQTGYGGYGSRGYFHIAEFQLYPVKVNVVNAPAYWIENSAGRLGTKDGFLVSTSQIALGATEGRFGIITLNNKNYLYSISDKKFMHRDTVALSTWFYHVALSNDKIEAFDYQQTGLGSNNYPYYLDSDGYAFSVDNTMANGVGLTKRHGVSTNSSFALIPAGTFDPTEAIATLQSYLDEEEVKALAEARQALAETIAAAQTANVNDSEAKAVYNNANATVAELIDANTLLKLCIKLATQAQTVEALEITEVLKNPDFSDFTVKDWETTYQLGDQAYNMGIQVQADSSVGGIDDAFINGDIVMSQFLEAYKWGGNFLIGDGHYRQTIIALPAGRYRLECDAIAQDQRSSSKNVTGAYIFAQNAGQEVRTVLNTPTEKPLHYSLEFVSDGLNPVTYGFKTQNYTGNWVAVDNFRLYCLETGQSSTAITFADANVKAICVANWDTNGDGELSYAEAAAVTDLGKVFSGKGITSFDELRYFTGLTSIRESAFSNCERLTSITIPEGINSIGNYAFYWCADLKSITIPNSVKSIGTSSFAGNFDLTTLTIPASVTKIASNAFYACQGLTSIVVDSENPAYDSRDNCNAIIETASNTLISGCQNTIIPSTVTGIGVNAFDQIYTLTSITIPEGVTSIGGGAFAYCRNLTAITIPASVSSLGRNPFYGCSGLTSIVVDSKNTIYDSRNNCNAIIETTSNTLISGCQNTIIPSTVTTINDEAFYECRSLKSIIIPSKVNRIGNQAFGYCNSLAAITSYIKAPFVFGNYAFSSISNEAILYVPAGTRDAYIAAGWTEQVFKGGIVEMAEITIPTEGLVAYYPFNGNANDESGHGNNGTVIGNVELTTDRFGNPNSAYRFFGEPMSYISVPDDESLHISTFTLNAWVYTDAEDYGSGYLINKGRDINEGAYHLTANSVCAFNDYYGDNTAYLDEMPATHVWHMITGIVEGDNARIYLDGQLKDERKLSHPFEYANSEPLTLGMHYFEGVPSSWAYPLLGVLDDVCIYNRVLSQSEIDSLYGGYTDNSQHGDVNVDGDIDVADVVMTVNYITGREQENFHKELADVNQDTEVNVADVVGIVALITGTEYQVKQAFSSPADDELTATYDGQQMLLDLRGAGCYTACQMTVSLPAGVNVNNVRVCEERKAGHTLVAERLQDGRYVIIAYSMKNASFRGLDGSLLQFMLPGAEGIVIDDIVFVTPQGGIRRFPSISIGNTTGIAEEMNNGQWTKDNEVDALYDLSGRQIVNSTSVNRSLKPGVYIKNGHKFTVK